MTRAGFERLFLTVINEAPGWGISIKVTWNDAVSTVRFKPSVTRLKPLPPLKQQQCYKLSLTTCTLSRS